MSLRSRIRDLVGGKPGPQPVAGDPLPTFFARAHDGSGVSPKRFKGKWLVLWFYPKADTPGWRLEAKSLRDGLSTLEQLDAIVVGVSRDSRSAALAFAEKHGLPYLLVPDEEGDVGKVLGVPARVGFYKRVTFLVRPDGHVAHVFDDVDVERHADQVAAKIRELAAA